MPVCVINNAKWQVRAFRFCHDANSSLHTFSDTTSIAHRTPPYGAGGYFQPNVKLWAENQSNNGHNPKVMPVALNCPLLAACHGAPLQETSYCFTIRYVLVTPFSALRRKRYIPAGNEAVFMNVSEPSNTPEARTTPCAFNNVYSPRSS